MSSSSSGLCIIGIDPGSRLTGCAVICQEQTHRAGSSASGYRCLLHTTLKAGNGSMPQRLAALHTQLQAIIQHYRPHEAALEQVFVHKNPKAALTLGQARGVLMLGLAQADIPIAEYAPRTIKQASVGYGAASKSQVQSMMQRIFKLECLPAEDAADALAVAMCHAHSRKLKQLVANNT